MFGPPSDVKDWCNARLFIGDDYGDNTTTIRCMREPNHEGKHREWFKREERAGDVVVEWDNDERKRCDHGCGGWEHYRHNGDDNDNIECPALADDHNDTTCRWCHPDQTEADRQPCPKCGTLVYLTYGKPQHDDCPVEIAEFRARGGSGGGIYDERDFSGRLISQSDRVPCPGCKSPDQVSMMVPPYQHPQGFGLQIGFCCRDECKRPIFKHELPDT